MVAVISGASRGIGRSLALALAEKGYSLALAARNIGPLEELKREIEANNEVEVLIKAADFSNQEDVVSFSETVLNHFKSITVLINNVGIYEMGRVTDSEVDFDRMMNINLHAAYNLTKPIALKMQKNRIGHIFNICSVLSNNVRVDAAAYTITKHALKGFNDVLREEMREFDVKVTAIYPGSINTSSWEGTIAPKENFVQPEDIVRAFYYCLSVSKNANVEEIVIKPLNKDH